MTQLQYRNNPLWRAALELGPLLARLADDLPGSEDNGIGQTLRSISIDLPATIAADMMSGGTKRHMVALKLSAALELIDRVYPALDTAAAKSASDALAEQLFDERFEGHVAPHAEGKNNTAVSPASSEKALDHETPTSLITTTAQHQPTSKDPAIVDILEDSEAANYGLNVPPAQAPAPAAPRSANPVPVASQSPTL